MSPDPEIINDIAVEMGVSPAFVEKDWFSIEVLKAVAAVKNDSFRAVFSGGTSLSKGYALIQRFSEDLDFRCLALRTGGASQMRRMRRAFRQDMLDAIGAVDQLVLDKEQAAIGSNYVKCELHYPQGHDDSPALRAGLRIEFSFTQPQLQPESRQIQSFVSRFTRGEPDLEIPCLSPVETAADKLSALVWRVLNRDRQAEEDDPTMIRHLHDIAALEPIVEKDKRLFIEAVSSAFAVDQQASKRDTGRSLLASIEAMVEHLKSDRLYRGEYGAFVDAMSYADDAERLDFDSAVRSLGRISGWFAH